MGCRPYFFMAQSSALPSELTARLQDEVLAERCFHAFKPEQSAAAALTRIPFALFGAAKSRSPFPGATKSGDVSPEAVRRERREQAERLRGWAAERVREQLDLYLIAASPEYQAYQELPQLAQRWRSTVDGIGDLLTAFAREVRTLLLHQSRPNPPPAEAAFAPLHKIVASLAGVGGRSRALSEQVAKLSHGRLGKKVALPELPELPSPAWLDGLVAKGAARGARELGKAAEVARDFGQLRKAKLLAQVPDFVELCAAAKVACLEAYWAQLRDYIDRHQTPAVEDPVACLQALALRREAVEERRLRDRVTGTPFAFTH